MIISRSLKLKEKKSDREDKIKRFIINIKKNKNELKLRVNNKKEVINIIYTLI